MFLTLKNLLQTISSFILKLINLAYVYTFKRNSTMFDSPVVLYLTKKFNKYAAKIAPLNNAPEDLLYLFAQYRKPEDRVRFALKCLRLSDALPPKDEVITVKNETYADMCRNSGNKHFETKDYSSALEYYNMALCFSKKRSKTMGLAYANRSAVYFKTGFYKHCLENIELALKNGYPEELKFKLVKRKNDCLYELGLGRNREAKPVPEPKLTYPAHPKIPFMVEGIEMKFNKKYGRHLVAKQDFKPGDVVIVEPQVSGCLYLGNVYKFCCGCFKSNLMNLMPCNEAITAMFCSEKCYTESKRKFFKYQGPILDAVYAIHTHKFSNCRLFFELFTLVENMDGLKKFADSLDANNKNPFQIDYKNATKLDLFRSYFTLEAHENSRPLQYNLNFAVEIALLYYYISKFTNFVNIIKTKEHEDLVMKLLLRISMIMSINGKPSSIIDVEPKANTVKKKAEATYLLIGLMNSSCCPNIDVVKGDSQILTVRYPIKAGQQLFLSNPSSFYIEPKLERQKFLRNRFFIDCTCIACEKNYPEIEGLQSKLNIDIEGCLKGMIDKYKISWTRVNDLDGIAETLKKCNEFQMKYHKFFPCRELHKADVYRGYCAPLLYLEEPLEVTFDVERKYNFNSKIKFVGLL